MPSLQANKNSSFSLKCTFFVENSGPFCALPRSSSFPSQSRWSPLGGHRRPLRAVSLSRILRPGERSPSKARQASLRGGVGSPACRQGRRPDTRSALCEEQPERGLSAPSTPLPEVAPARSRRHAKERDRSVERTWQLVLPPNGALGALVQKAKSPHQAPCESWHVKL